MTPDYTLAFDKGSKGFALYRKDALVATWDHDPMLENNKAYVDSQVRVRAGLDGVIEEIQMEKPWPQTLEKPKVAPKASKTASEAKGG